MKTDLSFLKSLGQFGWTGVDLFFVLSGFLIGGQLFRSLQRTGEISLKTFYIRRAFRILPSFLFVLVLYGIMPSIREAPWSTPAWRFLTFTQNFGLSGGAFSHAWSLCIEEQFYWLFPLLALTLFRFKKATIPSIIGIFVLGMIVRNTVWSSILNDRMNPRDLSVAYFKYIYYPTYSHLDGLTVGVSLALLQVYRSQTWQSLVRYGHQFIWAGLILVSLAFILFLKPYSPLAVVLGFPILSLGYGCLLIAAAEGSNLLARIKIPGAHGVAVLAYPMYLTHKQVIHWTSGHFAGPVFLPLALFLIFGVALGVHLLVENPCLKFRDRLVNKDTVNLGVIVNGLRHNRN